MTHKFQKGDVVRVTRKIEAEAGWENVWVCRMDLAIGHTFRVEGSYDELGIELFTPEDIGESDFDAIDEACNYRYPPGCLELVSQAVLEGT